MVGEPFLIHKVKQCPCCQAVYRFEEIRNIIPPYGNYLFDVIVEVGLTRYRNHRQNDEIRQEIKDRFGLTPPPSPTIGTLANAFLDYLAAVHYRSNQTLSGIINARSGYALHLDGTCEAGTDIIFALLDGHTKLVLVSGKMPTENSSDIAALIEKCISLFGVPLAIMRDLSGNIEAARKMVTALNDVLDLICHYHFLRAVGEALSEKLHANLTKRLPTVKLQPAFRSLRHDMVKASKGHKSISEEEVNKFIDDPQSMSDLDPVQMRRRLAYTILSWLDDYGADLNGEYFPFDLPSLAFCRRCLVLHEKLRKRLDAHQLKPRQLQTIRTIIAKFVVVSDDKELAEAVKRMITAEKTFNKL
jgi:hypothetical protein